MQVVDVTDVIRIVVAYGHLLITGIMQTRNNWLFAGSLRAGQRGAAVMSLIQSAKLNGHDPYAYLRDVLTRRPSQRNSMIAALLPHRWQPRASLAPTA